MGRILLVDLGSGEIADGVYEEYLSGTGLASYLLSRMITAGADPLAPENVLGFVSGLLLRNGEPLYRQMDSSGKIAVNRNTGRRQQRGLILPRRPSRAAKTEPGH